MKNNRDVDKIHEGGVDIVLRRDMAVVQIGSVMDRLVLPQPYWMILRGGMAVLEGAGILARGTGSCT